MLERHERLSLQTSTSSQRLRNLANQIRAAVNQSCVELNDIRACLEATASIGAAKNSTGSDNRKIRANNGSDKPYKDVDGLEQWRTRQTTSLITIGYATYSLTSAAGIGNYESPPAPRGSRQSRA